MILILLNWIFIFITCLGIGLFFLNGIERYLKTEDKDESMVFVFIGGLIFIAVIANIVSFLLPLNAYVRYVVFAFSTIVLLRNRVRVAAMFKSSIAWYSALHPGSKIILIAIFLISLIKSAGPSELIDEGGYFLPYIRWMEDYRLIPGIANLEDRMGFNSSFHMLCAFFSMRDWFDAGLYDLNGLLLIICSAYFITGPDRLLSGKSQNNISDFVKAFCLFFLLRNMLTAPAGDLSNVFFTELALVLFIEKSERGNLKDVDRHLIMIFLIAILLITIKVSSIGLILLPVYILFLTGKKFRKSFSFFFALGAVVILLWITRSYFLSGYLVYPVYFVDLFDPVWKVPEAFTKNQYVYVQQFARLNVERAESEHVSGLYSMREWVPLWFNMQNAFNKITAIALLGAVLASFYLAGFRKSFKNEFLVLYLVLLINLVLWFLGFPAFRFGWAFIIVFIALIATVFLIGTRLLQIYRYTVILVLILFTVQSLYKTFRENSTNLTANIIFPVTEPHPPTVEITFKTGVSAKVSDVEECWGVAPPCLPVNYNRKIEAIGNSVTDGFYISKE